MRKKIENHSDVEIMIIFAASCVFLLPRIITNSFFVVTSSGFVVGRPY